MKFPIYGLDRYNPPDRLWFFGVLNLKWDIIFALVGIVFPVGSLGRAPKLDQLQRNKNYRVLGKQFNEGLCVAIKFLVFVFLNRASFFGVLALNGVSTFVCLIP